MRRKSLGKTMESRYMELRRRLEEYREKLIKQQMEIVEKIERLIAGEL